MKKLLLILIVLFAWTINVFATNYFVTPTGNASDPDCSGGGAPSCAGAWDMSDFNTAANWSVGEDAAKIDPGDTVYFTGTFTIGGLPQGDGTSGNQITLDGYYAGDYDALNEGSDGQAIINRTEWYSGNMGFFLDDDNYITVQDFEIREISHGVYLDDSSNIIIRRNYIHDAGSNGIKAVTSAGTSENITIGGTSGDGNVIKNAGVGTASGDIVIAGCNDIIISYNHLYATLADSLITDRGIDGIVPMNGTYNVLIEYNSIHSHNDNYTADTFPAGPCGAPCVGRGEDGIDIKDDNCGPVEWSNGTHDIIIRFNHIYDNIYQTNIVAQSCSYNIYIYGNRIHESNWGGGYFMEGAGGAKIETHDIYYYSNIVFKEQDTGIRIHANSGGVGPPPYNMYFFNNTFAENATDGGHTNYNFGQIDATESSPTSTYVKNNIFYKSRIGYGSNQERQLYFGNDLTDETDLDYNRYWWPTKVSQIYINAGWDDAIDVGHNAEQNGSEGDPGLVDIDNNNYRIDTGAAVIDGGTDMGSGAITTITIQGVEYPVNWDIGLGSNTDWSGIIPVVEVLARDTYGWDQGAYVSEEAIYYVTQAGAGNYSGSDIDNAMRVENEFNALSGNKEGNTYFFSGTITSEVVIDISGTGGGGYITLDGYQAGDVNHISGEDTNAALIDINNKSTGVRGIYANRENYIIIQDFRIKRAGHGIYFEGESTVDCTNIIIRRVWVEDMYNIGIELGGADGSAGVSYGTIQDSVIYDIGRSRSTSAISNINLDQGHNIVIKNNHIYNHVATALVYDGADGVVGHGVQGLLLEGNLMYHFGEDALDFKMDGTQSPQNLIARYNRMYDTKQYCITVQGEGDNAYIYANYFGKEGETTGDDLVIQMRGFEDVFVWANIFYKPDHAGFIAINVNETKVVDNSTLWNNTIVKSGQQTDPDQDFFAGIAWWDAKTSLSHEAYNNILIDNNEAANLDFQIWMDSNITFNGTTDYNLFHLTGDAPNVDWDGNERELTNPMASNVFCTTDGQDCNGNVGAPLFVDYGNQNFTLQVDSPAIDSGTPITTGGILNGRNWDVPTIQGVDYSLIVTPDLALDPSNTDWTTIPPTVQTLDQDDYGSIWDQGAYIRITAEPTAGKINFNPSGSGKFTYDLSGSGKIIR
jgi:hypothetical protein